MSVEDSYKSHSQVQGCLLENLSFEFVVWRDYVLLGSGYSEEFLQHRYEEDLQ
jgi:hypothetical protein